MGDDPGYGGAGYGVAAYYGEQIETTGMWLAGGGILVAVVGLGLVMYGRYMIKVVL